MSDFQAEIFRDFSVPPRLKRHLFARRRAVFFLTGEKSPHWTLIAAIEGEWEFGVGAARGTCETLEWVLCPPGTRFERRVTRAPLSFHLARFEWDVSPDACPLVGWNAPHDRARMAGNLEWWRETQNRDDGPAQQIREHVLSDILRLAWAQSGQKPADLRAPDAAMEAARRFLETAAANPVSIAQLAARCGLSPVAFTRRFRAATGQTPSQFLTICRLERARTLLLDSDATLDAVAAQCGFGSGFYLSRVWSKKWGGTPSSFRRAHRV